MKEFWKKDMPKRSMPMVFSLMRFFKQIDKMMPGSLLLPAEGEGRNTVYAAKSGCTVTAFDSSSVAKDKALRLAKSEAATIDYGVRDLIAF